MEFVRLLGSFLAVSGCDLTEKDDCHVEEVDVDALESELGLDADAQAEAFEGLGYVTWQPLEQPARFSLFLGEPRAYAYSGCDEEAFFDYEVAGSVGAAGLFEGQVNGRAYVTATGSAVSLYGTVGTWDDEWMAELVGATEHDPEAADEFDIRANGSPEGGQLEMYAIIEGDAVTMLSGAWAPVER